jgi:hypothetical protein
VAAGDLNGDGRLDLAVANQGDNTVSVLLGNGNGTFQHQVTYPVGSFPVSVAVGDFSGDSKLDLAVVNNQNNTVGVLLGNGNGTFQSQVSFPVGSSPYSMAVGDFNGDGKQDIAVPSFGSTTVSVLLGKGDGTFQPQVSYPVGTAPDAVAVGDFNGDTKPDVAVANFNSNTVGVLLGNGNGTFQPQVSFPVGSAPARMAVGDFNGDGKQDLAVANESSNTVSVLLNGGPCLTVSPTSGYPSQALTLSGVNLGASEAVSLYWDGTSGTALTGTRTDATGAFTTNTKVPLSTGGAHSFIAVGQSSGIAVSVALQVVPILALSQETAVAGATVRTQGAGFGASELVTVYWGSPTHGSVLGATTTSTRGFFGIAGSSTAVTFTVPAVSPATYRVCAKGQSSGAVACHAFTVTG